MFFVPKPVRFSRRRREILEMICRGSAAQQIAYELELSVSTVNSHIVEICRLARVSRNQLVIYTLQHPKIFERDHQCGPGLHPADCGCDFCDRMRRLLKQVS